MRKIGHVMIVDDDEEDRDFLCQAVYLIDPSIVCSTAIDGQHGLQVLESGQALPDCVFLDLNMPGVNGKDFLKTIKKKPALKEIPVVIYTTSKLAKDKIETARLGAAQFISKPATLREIEVAIRIVFDQILT